MLMEERERDLGLDESFFYIKLGKGGTSDDACRVQLPGSKLGSA